MQDEYIKFKREVISHYSPEIKCKKCGCDDIRCLTISHINGNGNKHRKLNGNTLSWLMKNNYPEGFEVLCGNCNLKKETVKKYLFIVKKKIFEECKNKRQKARYEVISHYSPDLKCNRCGNNDYDVLTIDHTNSNGHIHRLNVGRKNIYKDIILNNFPEGEYQILCMNCQLIKSDENCEHNRKHNIV